MNIKADFPHSNTTGKNHVLEQKKAVPLLFFYSRNATIILFLTSLLFMADWSGSLRKTEYPSCARFFFSGLKAFGV